MENNEVKKNNNKGLIIIIIILILIIIGMVCFYVFSNMNTTSKTNNEPVEKEELKEVELKDEDIISDLNKKIYYITNETKDGTTNMYTFRYKNEIFGDAFNNLNDDLKLYIALDYLYNENKFVDLAPENENDPIVKDYVQAQGANYVKQISGSEVKSIIKNFFGTDKIKLGDTETGGKCFTYNYESTKDIFYKMSSTCGGTTPSVAYYYKNKYTKKGDNIYVYANYGIASPSSEQATDYTIYKELEAEEIFKPNITAEEAVAFRIDETNYSDFSQYKYTFKKSNDGTYYLVSIEKQ